MRKTKLLLAACALLMCVGLQAKINVTSQYLVDADLSSLNGWGNPGRTDWRTDGAVNVVEFWNWSNQFNFSQTASLPAGYYRLAVNAFYRHSWSGNGTNENMAWIFAGEKTKNVVALNSMSDLSGYAGNTDLYRAATAFSQGKFSNEFDFNVTGEGTTQIEIGFRGTCPNGGWCILGPVTLWEYTVEDYQSDFNEKKAVAEGLYDSPMNATVLSELQAAANATFTTIDAIIEGGHTLDAAIVNAENSIAVYAKTKSTLDTYAELVAALDEQGQAAYDVSAVQAAYDNRSMTVDLSAEILTAYIVAYRAQEGTDATEYIVNPSFETGIDGWTVNTSGDTGARENSNPTYTMSNADGNYVFNTWNGGTGYPISQVVEGLPNGAYNLSAIMATDAGKTFNLKGNDVVGTAASFNKETGVLVSADEIVIIDGKLTIEAITADNSWYKVDDFRLTFMRELTEEEELPLSIDLYEKALLAAQGITAGTIPTAAYYVHQQTIAANTLTEGTAAQYEAATAALNAATETATSLQESYATWLGLKTEALALATGHQAITGAIGKVAQYVETITTLSDLNDANTMTVAMIANYSAWNELKESADALVAVSNDNAEANATLQEAIDTQFNAISTLAQEINDADISTPAGILAAKAKTLTLISQTIPNATAALKAAMTTYVKTAEPTNEECFDLTFLIVNPHFTDGVGGRGQVAAGWTLESGAVTEHRLATHNFEAWHTQFNLSQTIADLPKGTYKVTLQGFARHDNANVTTKTNLYCGIVDQEIKNIQAEYSTTSFYNNNTPALGDNNRDSYDQATGYYRPNGMTGAYYWFQQTNPATGQPFYTNEVQTLITEAGDLKIGFKCEANEDWVIWDNFHLYYYGSAIAVTLDETAGSSFSEDIDNANVTLKKTIYEGWNTIVIPFKVNDIAELNGTKLYEFTGYDESTKTLMFSEATAIEPNIPYMLKASTASTGDFTFNNVTVKAATDLTTGEGGYNFVGTYQEVQVADGDYILYEKDGAAGFGRSSGGNKVKAYRAYIKRLAEGDDQARIAISFNGQTTAIDAIDGQTIGNGAIYNLAGQKVEKAQKGIYIQNGKKMVIK